MTDGRKPSLLEWEAFKAFFRENPFLRIDQGTRRSADENSYFIRYHRAYPNGEHWGTKQQLVNHREALKRGHAKWQKNQMQTNPEFRERQLESLARLVEKQRRLEEISEDVRKARLDKKAAKQRIKRTKAPRRYSMKTEKKRRDALRNFGGAS